MKPLSRLVGNAAIVMCAAVTTVLAILELWRQQAVSVVQSECYGAITLLPKSDAEEET